MSDDKKELNEIKEVDGSKVSIDDLNTDDNNQDKKEEELKGLKKIRGDDSTLVKQAKQLYNDELKFQLSRPSIHRNKLRLDLYNGLIYLASMKCSDEAYKIFSEKIIGYQEPNEHQIKGIEDRRAFLKMDEVKAFLAFLKESEKVYKKNKSWVMLSLIKVLVENMKYHPYCQGSFYKARFAQSQERAEKKKEKDFTQDDDDDIPF